MTNDEPSVYVWRVTCVLCPSSGYLSLSKLLVLSLSGLDSCRSFIGVLRFCRGVCAPSNLKHMHTCFTNICIIRIWGPNDSLKILNVHDRFTVLTWERAWIDLHSCRSSEVYGVSQPQTQWWQGRRLETAPDHSSPEHTHTHTHAFILITTDDSY